MSIPNKSNFKFQELTPITGVKPYVIRYWETEFPEIDPITSEKGEKIYARKDVEVILRVKKLLFEDKLTIPEAKMRLATQEVEVEEAPVLTQTVVTTAPGVDVRPLLKESLEFIRDIKAKRNW